MPTPAELMALLSSGAPQSPALPPPAPDPVAMALASQRQAATPDLMSGITPAGSSGFADLLRQGPQGVMLGLEQGLGSIPGVGPALGGLVGMERGRIEQGMGAPPNSPAAPPPFTAPGIPGLADRLRAAGAAGATGGGTSHMSTRLGRPQDVGYLQGERAAGEKLASEQEQVTARLSQVNALHDQTLRDWAVEAKEAHVRFGEVGREMSDNYRETAGELRAARDELKTMKVDPQRLMNSMPTTQKALMMIGSLAGGFAEGVSGGKMQNDVGRWWQQAVDKDIESQRDAIKAKMAEVELGTKERDSIWNKWQESENQIRTAAARASQMEISRLALATDDVKLKGELAKSINDIGARVRSEEHGEFVAAQNVTTKGYSSGGGAGAAGGLTPEKVQGALYFQKAAQDAQVVKKILADNGGKVPLWGADAARYKAASDQMLYHRALAQGAKGRELNTALKVGREMLPDKPGALSRLKQWATGSQVPQVQGEEATRLADDVLMEGQLAAASLGSRAAKKKGK